MEQVIAWCLFAGSWLLVGGPLYQAAIDITEHYEWPQWVFWALLVFMMASAVLNTALRMIGSQNALRTARAGSASPST